MFTKTWALAVLTALASAAPIPSSALPAISGPGVILENVGTMTTEFCFFNNISNGDGTAVPNFDTPTVCKTLASGASTFVPLDASFKGRAQRTKNIPATWAEFQLSASNDNKAHGDISIEQGSDGPIEILSTDGTNQVGGFTKELVPIAPEAATMIRAADGQRVLKSTMGNWLAAASTEAASFAASQIDASKTYITGGTGVADVSSSNQAVHLRFY